MSTNSRSGRDIGVVTGVIGVVVTAVVYWVNLSIFDQPFVTESGVWITVVVSAFLTGWIPITIADDGGMGMGFAAGFVGAVVAIVLYWVNLVLFGEPFVTTAGVWITVVISVFLTGWVPFAIRS